jgi:hypothetical protein
MFETDLTFPHSYLVDEPGEFPGSGSFAFPVLRFPPPKARSGEDGFWVKITPEVGTPWIGVFAFLFDSPHTYSRVVSTPDPNRVCVISNGVGDVVKADEPEVWEEIPIEVLGLLSATEHQLLVFYSYTRLFAYGSRGPVWRSPRVCWDELRILKVTSDTIEGTGFDPTNSITNELPFVVDIRTGRSLLPPPKTTHGEPVW